MNTKDIRTYIVKAEEETYETLSSEERARMRSTVHAYMEMKPVRSQQGIQRVRSSISSVSWRFASAALVLIVCFSGAGISYAAQGALPGDVLYSIKTGINEPLAGALAVTDTQKAEWASSVASERLKEAAILAATGNLTPDKEHVLEVSFDDHAALVIAHMGAATSSDTQAKDEATVAFDGKLQAYQDILANIEVRQHASSTMLRTAIAHAQALLADDGDHLAETSSSGASAVALTRNDARAEVTTSLRAVPQLAAFLTSDVSANTVAAAPHENGPTDHRATAAPLKSTSVRPALMRAASIATSSESTEASVGRAASSSTKPLHTQDDVDSATQVSGNSSTTTSEQTTQSSVQAPFLPAATIPLFHF